jgi:hypothetical protein
MTRTPGQLAYEADCERNPHHEDGSLRRTWAEIGDVARWSWERDPQPRDWTKPHRQACAHHIRNLRQRETSAPKPCPDFLRYLSDTEAALPTLEGAGLYEALQGLRHFTRLPDHNLQREANVRAAHGYEGDA